MDLADIGSPAAVSRHLVLPMGSGLPNHINHSDTKNEDSDEEHDEGKVASFCVLLHGALKVIYQLYSPQALWFIVHGMNDLVCWT